jgi:hypothetical protein
MKKGDTVFIRIEMMSGLLECNAKVIRYEPPQGEWDTPIIWVVPDGRKPKDFISITKSDIVERSDG